MKRLATLLLIALCSTVCAAIPTNQVVEHIDIDDLDPSARSDYKHKLFGFNTYEFTYNFDESGTPSVVSGVSFLYRVTGRIGGSNRVFIAKAATDITLNTSSSITFSVANTNIPPNGEWNSEILGYEGALTNVTRTYGRGLWQVKDSLYDDDGTGYPFPNFNITNADNYVTQQQLIDATNAVVDLSVPTLSAVLTQGNDAESQKIDNVLDVHFVPTNSTVSSTAGNVFFDENDDALAYRTSVADAIMQIGQEMWLRAKKSGSAPAITNGVVVYIDGASGDRPTINLADADNAAADEPVGFATHTFAGSDGFVTIHGLVRDVDTSAYSAGDDLYLANTPGEVTNVEPTSGTVYHVGTVARSHASAGIIYVNVERHWENEIAAATNGVVDDLSPGIALATNSITQRSIQRFRADGTYVNSYGTDAEAAIFEETNALGSDFIVFGPGAYTVANSNALAFDDFRFIGQGRTQTTLTFAKGLVIPPVFTGAGLCWFDSLTVGSSTNYTFTYSGNNTAIIYVTDAIVNSGTAGAIRMTNIVNGSVWMYGTAYIGGVNAYSALSDPNLYLGGTEVDFGTLSGDAWTTNYLATLFPASVVFDQGEQIDDVTSASSATSSSNETEAATTGWVTRKVIPVEATANANLTTNAIQDAAIADNLLTNGVQDAAIVAGDLAATNLVIAATNAITLQHVTDTGATTDTGITITSGGIDVTGATDLNSATDVRAKFNVNMWQGSYINFEGFDYEAEIRLGDDGDDDGAQGVDNYIYITNALGLSLTGGSLKDANLSAYAGDNIDWDATDGQFDGVPHPSGITNGAATGTDPNGSIIVNGIVEAIGEASLSNTLSSLIVSDSTSTGAELTTNGTFTGSAGGWLLTSASYQSSGTYSNSVRIDAGTTGTITPSNAIAHTLGNVYLVSYTLYVPAGTAAVETAFGGITNNTATAADMTRSLVHRTVTTNQPVFSVTVSTNSAAYFDSVSIKLITDGDIHAADQIYAKELYINGQLLNQGGEINAGENVGAGDVEVYAGKSSTNLQFKTLIEGTGITLTETPTNITITSSGGGGSPIDSRAATNNVDMGGFSITNVTLIQSSGQIDITHTATGDNEHAIEIDVFTDGFADIRALEVEYDASTLAAGEDDAVILANIIAADTTGGEVFGLEILATEGSADVYALKAGPEVNLLVQNSGVFVDMDGASNNGVNALADFIDAGVTSTLFVADNDTVTIGSSNTFEDVEFLLSRSANNNITPTFEYSSGTNVWTAFTPTDGTDGMQFSGVISWEASDQGSLTVGLDDMYWFRITRTRNGLPTTPQAYKVQISSTTQYKWDAGGNIDAASVQSSSVIWSNAAQDWAEQVLLPGGFMGVLYHTNTVVTNRWDLK